MAVRPAVHPSTDRLYFALGRAFYGPDQEEGATQWHLLRYLDAVGAQLGQVDDLVRDSDDGPGWSALFDVDRVPLEHLAHLAQYVGVRIPANQTEAQQRDTVRAAPGWGRGTPAVIQEAARVLLTGTQTVRMYERDGGAYQLRVRTYLAETPDPAAVQAALDRAKPAGIVLTYETLASGTYDDLGAEFGTYDDLGASGMTYADLDNWVP